MITIVIASMDSSAVRPRVSLKREVRRPTPRCRISKCGVFEKRTNVRSERMALARPARSRYLAISEPSWSQASYREVS